MEYWENEFALLRWAFFPSCECIFLNLTVMYNYLFSLKLIVVNVHWDLGDSMSGEQDHVSKSSSSSISTSTQESEEEVSVTIGSLLAQANNSSRHSLGKRLSHLGSIPVIQSQPMFVSLFHFTHLHYWTLHNFISIVLNTPSVVIFSKMSDRTSRFFSPQFIEQYTGFCDAKAIELDLYLKVFYC